MSKGANQKLKLYYLWQILRDKTDETHYMTMAEIIEELGKYDISAERKSIYRDIEDLKNFGIEVVGAKRGREHGYQVVKREFDVAEMKLFVDAIQSSKFITEKKTRELISKLEMFVSKYDAKKLQRQVHVQGRVKSMNEGILQCVDVIHTAIADNRKIRFQYCSWDINKKLVPRHGGEFYNVSPLAMSWDDENYYLIAYDVAADRIKHFRVDKIINISETDAVRDGKILFENFNLAEYVKKNFGMFGGESQQVKLVFTADMVGVILDRFGTDIMVMPEKDGRYSVWVDVAVSQQFMGWVFALGGGVEIAGPEPVLQRVRKEVERLRETYL